MIVLIGGEKGGTGKSTIATNLAVWLAHRQRDTILVDADRQETSNHWTNRRNENANLATVHCAQKYGNVFNAIKDLARRYEEIIIDAGGHDSEELRTALIAAHRIYVPFKASQPDLETSLHMNELIQLARGMNPNLEAYAIIAMAPTNPVINEPQEAQDLLKKLTELRLAKTLIHERKVYRDAMLEGKGVIEMNNSKGRNEIEALGQEIYHEPIQIAKIQ